MLVILRQNYVNFTHFSIIHECSCNLLISAPLEEDI